MRMAYFKTRPLQFSKDTYNMRTVTGKIERSLFGRSPIVFETNILFRLRRGFSLSGDSSLVQT